MRLSQNAFLLPRARFPSDREKRDELVPILIWQYLSSSQKESAPIGASLFILTVLLRDIVRSIRHQLVPILISQNLSLQLKWRGTNWCRFWFDNISHYHRRKSAPNGASLFILNVLLRDIVRSRSAPTGADFDITESLITVKMKRDQLVPILI